MSVMDDDSLLRKLEGKMEQMTEVVTRLVTHFDTWAPVWKQQTDGIVSLDNRHFKMEGELKALDIAMSARMQSLEDKFEADKKYRESLENIAKSSAEERRINAAEAKKAAEEESKRRTDGQRWVVGLIMTVLGLLVALLGFVAQHSVVIK